MCASCGIIGAVCGDVGAFPIRACDPQGPLACTVGRWALPLPGPLGMTQTHKWLGTVAAHRPEGGTDLHVQFGVYQKAAKAPALRSAQRASACRAAPCEAQARWPVRAVGSLTYVSRCIRAHLASQLCHAPRWRSAAFPVSRLCLLSQPSWWRSMRLSPARAPAPRARSGPAFRTCFEYCGPTMGRRASVARPNSQWWKASSDAGPELRDKRPPEPAYGAPGARRGWPLGPTRPKQYMPGRPGSRIGMVSAGSRSRPQKSDSVFAAAAREPEPRQARLT